MSNQYKSILSILMVGVFTLSFTLEASAYELIGHKLTQAPYNRYYWNDTVTTNLGGFNAKNNCDLAVSAWSSSPNTKIYLHKTTSQVESIMDFHSIFKADANELGWIVFFNGSTQIQPSVSDYSWVKMHINTNGNINWMQDPTSYKYVEANGKQQHVWAHEAGHGFGLDHVWAASWNANVLMTPTPSSYYNYGTKGPKDDEVAGVQAIYGKLY
ncbi:matrixin family metalloprotease [Tumebacillus lipolyticus]|uniref:Matrixin family metalloprotease n=1 Tax=Tumebacillus lipolyticus TaxID=1280370 RepID=A0ABW4ZYR7_9BACL